MKDIFSIYKRIKEARALRTAQSRDLNKLKGVVSNLLDKNNTFLGRLKNISSFLKSASSDHAGTTGSDTESFKTIFINTLNAQGLHCLYHFTPYVNLSRIRASGGLYSWEYLHNHGMVVPFEGGNDRSKSHDESRGLQSYVRLSFCKEHPMSYRLRKEEHQDIAILEIDPAIVDDETLFSDINAASPYANVDKGPDGLKLVNFRAVKIKYLSKDAALFPYKQAEIMITTYVPNKYILNLSDPIVRYAE